jgi:uncharacterized membrane protein YccF (DUF307 family)
MHETTLAGVSFGSVSSILSLIFKPLFGLYLAVAQPILSLQADLGVLHHLLEIIYVFLTGFVGALGGLLATKLWKRLFKKQ